MTINITLFGVQLSFLFGVPGFRRLHIQEGNWKTTAEPLLGNRTLCEGTINKKTKFGS